MSGSPLFPGKTENMQLLKIFKVLGTPTAQNWPGMTELPHYEPIVNRSVEFAGINYPPVPLTQICKRFITHPDALDLVQRMLRYDSASRISASDALNHPVFNQLNQSSNSGK